MPIELTDEDRVLLRAVASNIRRNAGGYLSAADLRAIQLLEGYAEENEGVTCWGYEDGNLDGVSVAPAVQPDGSAGIVLRIPDAPDQLFSNREAAGLAVGIEKAVKVAVERALRRVTF